MNDNDLVYHYTSVATLVKIVDSMNNGEIYLRATHVKYFNDPMEYESGLSLFKKSMIQYEQQNRISDPKSQRYNEDSVARLSWMPGPPFLLSFSGNKNDLMMWRNYGDDGKGVSIGFDRKLLSEYAESNDNAKLLKCNYDEEAVVKELVEKWSKYYPSVNFMEGGGIAVGSSVRFIFDLIRTSFEYKTEEYSPENEWRLCKSEWKEEQIKYFERGGVIIPYVDFKFSKDIIKKIFVGPCANILATESIKNFIKAKGYDVNNDFIIQSKLPYRKL